MLPFVIRRKLRGRNAVNWPGLVVLGRGIERPAAVAAQEIWEARHKLSPVNLLRRLTSKSHRRRMELMGHEVEVQASAMLYGQAETEARRREAGALRRGYDGLFRHMTIPQIEAAMLARSVPARAWVTANLREIRRYL